LELTFNVSVFLTLAAILMLGRFYVNILARMFQPATVRILGIAIVLVMPTFYFGRSRNRLIAQPPEEAAALMKKK
jgi:hypothetical protein